jgi:hypothetical protein
MFAKQGFARFLADTGNFAPIVLKAGNAFSIDVQNNRKYTRIYIGAMCPPDKVMMFLKLLELAICSGVHMYVHI